jgi:pyrroline-5-carboxylate reductase
MQDFQHKQLGFIGGGNMGRAIVGGLIASGFPAGRIVVADPYGPGREDLARSFGVRTTADNAVAVEGADVVVLAVKPQQLAEVVTALRPALAAHRPLLLSVAAGIRVSELAAWAGPDLAVVRSMPNRPALLGVGATGLYAADSTTEAQRALAEQVLAVTGLTVWVRSEAELDWVTALSGSGPAYFFLLAELLARSAAAHGIDATTAARLAAHTLHGAGRMAVMPGADLATLRAEVTSKGGTTAAALASFEANGLADLVEAAVVAAATRSQELGDVYGQSPTITAPPTGKGPG